MTYNLKNNFNFTYWGLFLLNLCLYFLICSVIYYFFSLNISFVKMIIFLFIFLLVFYLSSKKTDLLLQKMKLKNIIILSKFLLGIATLNTAVLIYNKSSLNSLYFYFLLLTVSVLSAVLNKAYSFFYKKNNSIDKIIKNSELIFRFNLEKVLIVIMVAFIAGLIKLTIIPIILTATAVYYFLSAYFNTFQEIKY